MFKQLEPFLVLILFIVLGRKAYKKFQEWNEQEEQEKKKSVSNPSENDNKNIDIKEEEKED